MVKQAEQRDERRAHLLESELKVLGVISLTPCEKSRKIVILRHAGVPEDGNRRAHLGLH